MKFFSLVLTAALVLACPAFGQGTYEKDGSGGIAGSRLPGTSSWEKQMKEGPLFASREAAEEEPKKDFSQVTVIMYMTDWCGYCRKAREYIRSLGAKLIEYNVEKDREKRDEMLQKSGGRTGVPVIDINGTIIPGYNPGAIKAALARSAR